MSGSERGNIDRIFRNYTDAGCSDSIRTEDRRLLGPLANRFADGAMSRRSRSFSNRKISARIPFPISTFRFALCVALCALRASVCDKPYCNFFMFFMSSMVKRILLKYVQMTERPLFLFNRKLKPARSAPLPCQSHISKPQFPATTWPGHR
jgi:hypothetical protein